MAAVSRAQRKSANKWDAAHMATMACKIKAEEAQAFKDYAEARGTTVNALLAGFIRRCLAADWAEKETGSGDA